MNEKTSARDLRSWTDNLKSKIKNQKWLGLSVITFVLVVMGQVVSAQQPKKISRLGYISATDPATDATRAEAIRKGLGEFGYIEGQNVAIDYRVRGGKTRSLP